MAAEQQQQQPQAAEPQSTSAAVNDSAKAQAAAVVAADMSANNKTGEFLPSLSALECCLLGRPKKKPAHTESERLAPGSLQARRGA